MPSLKQWNVRYCFEAKKVWVGKGGRPLERWVGVSDVNGGELHALLGEVMVRKRKEDVLHELPPKRRSKVVLMLKPSQLKVRTLGITERPFKLIALALCLLLSPFWLPGPSIVLTLCSPIDGGDPLGYHNMCQAVSKQMAALGDLKAGLIGGGSSSGLGSGSSSGLGSGFGAGEDDESDGASLPTPEVMAIFKQLADAKASGVCDWLENALLDGCDASAGASGSGESSSAADPSSQRKSLIFAHHHSMHDAIATFLGKSLKADEWIHITGRTPQQERSALLDKFQTEPKCR